jgi:hypothetical protein
MDSLNRLRKPIGTDFFDTVLSCDIQGGPYIGWSNPLGPHFLAFNTTLSCDISLESAIKIEKGYEAVK